MYSSLVGRPANPTTTHAQPTSIVTVTETSNSNSPASPTSPTARGRLRGLSYLRSYTQNHILSRDNHNHNHNHTHNHNDDNNNNNTNNNPAKESRPAVGRADSFPSSIDSPTTGTVPAGGLSPAPPPRTPTAQRSTTDLSAAGPSNRENLGSTSGWLPIVGGQSAVSTTTASSSAVLLSTNDPSAATSMARTRTATNGGATDMPHVEETHSGVGHNGANGMSHQLPSIRFSTFQDPRSQRPSLVFTSMSRILPTGKEIIKVGRYSERDNQPPQATNTPSSAPVGFKSKVVSRRHCEFWCQGGSWFIKDVKSSSGTFLNHIRLSSPGTESRPFPVNDGDIVQLGIDFKGGEEMIFRCVKIRVELNKGWQTGPTSFK